MSRPDPPPLMVAPFHLGSLEQEAGGEKAPNGAPPVTRARQARRRRSRRRVVIALTLVVILALAAIWLLGLRRGVVVSLVACGVLGVIAVMAGAPG